MNYLAIVDFYFIWYPSNLSNYFNETMSTESNTRNSGIRQDILDTTTEFTQSLAALCGWMDQKFEDINSQLVNI